MATTFLDPLPKILSKPLAKDDLLPEYQNSEGTTFLEKFEHAWGDFISERSLKKLPRGKRENHIESMQKEISKLDNSKKTVERELREQLTFFQKSRQDVEEQFDQKLREAMSEQQALHTELSEKLANLKQAESLQRETMAWFHYLEGINDIAAQSDRVNGDSGEDGSEKSISEDALLARAVQPSSRAMFLAKATGRGCSTDFIDTQLRAYHIDQALLKTHVKMLQREIERVERLTPAQAEVGEFLAENNVWDIMGTRSNDEHMVDEGSVDFGKVNTL